MFVTDSGSLYLWLPRIQPTQTPSHKARLDWEKVASSSAFRELTSGCAVVVVNEIL